MSVPGYGIEAVSYVTGLLQFGLIRREDLWLTQVSEGGREPAEVSEGGREPAEVRGEAHRTNMDQCLVIDG